MEEDKMQWGEILSRRYFHGRDTIGAGWPFGAAQASNVGFSRELRARSLWLVSES